MISIQVKNNVNTPKIKRRVQQANLKSVEHAAATLRKIILNSIRKGKLKDGKRKSSLPGKPPKTWENRSGRRMKRDIFYTKSVSDVYGRSSSTVSVQPEKSGDRVYQLHESGGSQTVEVIQFMKTVQDRQARATDRTYKPMAERSAKEQKAIRDYYDNQVTVKKEKKTIKIRGDYPKRPFIEPAIKKIVPRLPEIWRTQITKTFY